MQSGQLYLTTESNNKIRRNREWPLMIWNRSVIADWTEIHENFWFELINYNWIEIRTKFILFIIRSNISLKDKWKEDLYILCKSRSFPLSSVVSPLPKNRLGTKVLRWFKKSPVKLLFFNHYQIVFYWSSILDFFKRLNLPLHSSSTLQMQYFFRH